MTDRPTLEQLIEAVQQHLEAQVIPAVRADQRLYFQTLVAINALKIAGRELAAGPTPDLREWEDLDRLHSTPPTPAPQALKTALAARRQTVCAAIRAGQYDSPAAWQRLRHYVTRQVEAQLIINAPALAQKLWAEDDSGRHPR